MSRMDPRLAAAVAEGFAAWHELQLGALGVASVRMGGWWLAPMPVPPIYYRAVALVPTADAAVLDAALGPTGWASAADIHAAVDLAAHGWRGEPPRPWYLRAPAAVGPVLLPPGCAVSRVTDAAGLAALEAAAAAGFGVAAPAPGGWHAAPSLGDPRAAAWAVRAGGATIATAMSLRAGGVVGIYGVATLPAWRRRGIGTALVRHVLTQDPALPAVLQPSPMAVGLYLRLGFLPVGSAASWFRPPRA